MKARQTSCADPSGASSVPTSMPLVGLPLGNCSSCGTFIELVPGAWVEPGQSRHSATGESRAQMVVSSGEYLMFVAFAATLEKSGSFDELLGEHTSKGLGRFVNEGVCSKCRE